MCANQLFPNKSQEEAYNPGQMARMGIDYSVIINMCSTNHSLLGVIIAANLYNHSIYLINIYVYGVLVKNGFV